MIRKSKTLLIIAMVLLAIIALTTIVTATYTPNQFKTKINTNATGSDKVKTMGGKIVGIIRVVGTIASVAMLTVIGIKYMIGSAEERAEYKKTMLPYFVGAVLIFGASNLTQVIYEWANAI